MLENSLITVAGFKTYRMNETDPKYIYVAVENICSGYRMRFGAEGDTRTRISIFSSTSRASGPVTTNKLAESQGYCD